MDKAAIASLKQQARKLTLDARVTFLFYFDKRARTDLTKGNALFIVDGSTFKEGDVKRTIAGARKGGAKVVRGEVDRSPDKKARFYLTKTAHAVALRRGLKGIGAKVPPLKPEKVLFFTYEGAPIGDDVLGSDDEISVTIGDDVLLSAVASTDDRGALQDIVAEGGPAGQAAALKLRGQVEARIREQLTSKLGDVPWSEAMGLKLRQLLDLYPAGDFSDSKAVLVAVRAAMVDGPVAAALDAAPPSDDALVGLLASDDEDTVEDARATLRSRMAAQIAAKLREQAAGAGEELDEATALAMARLAVRDVEDFDNIAGTVDELAGTLLARQIALSEALADEVAEVEEPEDLGDLPGYLSEPVGVVRRRLAKLATDATAEDDEAPRAYAKRLKLAEYIASTLTDDELSPPATGVAYLIARIQDALVEEEYPDITPIQLATDVFTLPGMKDRLKALLERAHGLLELDDEQVLLTEHRDSAYATIQALEKAMGSAPDKVKPYVGLYIRNLNVHFFTATRREKDSGASGFFKKHLGSDHQSRTLLELPDGKQLELWNKVHPETGEEVELGEGGFGYGRFGVLHDPVRGVDETIFVKKMRHSKQDVVASNPHIEEQIKNTDRLELKAFLKEVDIMRRLQGLPNIVEVHDGIVSKGSDGKEKMYLMMEMLPGGDVEGIIGKQDERGALGITAKKLMVKQALTGLKSVHDAGIIHRDIKPENLMIDGDGVVKLVDFGTASLTDERGRVVSPDSTGTPGFRPPSIDYGGDVSKKPPVYIYTKANDIYAMKKTVEALLAGVDLSEDDDLRGFVAAFDRADITCDDLLAMPAMADIDEDQARIEREAFRDAG